MHCVLGPARSVGRVIPSWRREYMFIIYLLLFFSGDVLISRLGRRCQLCGLWTERCIDQPEVFPVLENQSIVLRPFFLLVGVFVGFVRCCRLTKNDSPPSEYIHMYRYNMYLVYAFIYIILGNRVLDRCFLLAAFCRLFPPTLSPAPRAPGAKGGPTTELLLMKRSSPDSPKSRE